MVGSHKLLKMERFILHLKTLHLRHTHTETTTYTTCLTHHYNNNVVPIQHYDGNVRSDRPFKGGRRLIKQPYITSTYIIPAKMHL
jgi:hypothetical protein